MVIAPAHGDQLPGMLALADAFAAAIKCVKANQLDQLMWTAAAPCAKQCFLLSGFCMKA